MQDYVSAEPRRSFGNTPGRLSKPDPLSQLLNTLGQAEMAWETQVRHVRAETSMYDTRSSSSSSSISSIGGVEASVVLVLMS